MFVKFFVLFCAFAVHAGASEQIANINVSTTIPFIGYKGTISVTLDEAGNLATLNTAGNIPNMKNQATTIQQLMNGQGFNLSGPKGQALKMSFDEGFSASSGGDLTVTVLMCTGDQVVANLILRKVAQNDWAIQSDGSTVTNFNLEAAVGLNAKFAGCFDEFSVTK